MDYSFHLFEIKQIDEIKNIIQEHENLQGFCVTMPYKQEILNYLNTLSPTAMECGNVNCVKIIRHNSNIELQGYNTDAYGFEYSLLNQLSIKNIQQAYILGSGGVSKTIYHILNKHNIPTQIVSRNPKNKQISYEEMNQSFGDKALFVNASPVGMHDLEQQMPNIDLNKINSTHQIFDLIYNPSPTLLMKECEKRGAKTIDGSQMLYQQAEKAWEIWQSK